MLHAELMSPSIKYVCMQMHTCWLSVDEFMRKYRSEVTYSCPILARMLLYEVQEPQEVEESGRDLFQLHVFHKDTLQPAKVRSNTLRCHAKVRSNTLRCHAKVRSNTLRCHAKVRSNTLRCHAKVRSNTLRCHAKVRSNILRCHCKGEVQHTKMSLQRWGPTY